MTRISKIGALVFLLAGCATGRIGSASTPSADELVGSYAMGWGGICYEIELRADRTYNGVDCAGGHFGPTDGPNRHFSGEWTLESAALSFSSIRPTGGLDLGPTEVLFHKGKPAFVELQFVARGKIAPMFLFTRQASE
jgi:hypothetical protein